MYIHRYIYIYIAILAQGSSTGRAPAQGPAGRGYGLEGAGAVAGTAEAATGGGASQPAVVLGIHRVLWPSSALPAGVPLVHLAGSVGDGNAHTGYEAEAEQTSTMHTLIKLTPARSCTSGA